MDDISSVERNATLQALLKQTDDVLQYNRQTISNNQREARDFSLSLDHPDTGPDISELNEAEIPLQEFLMRIR